MSSMSFGEGLRQFVQQTEKALNAVRNAEMTIKPILIRFSSFVQRAQTFWEQALPGVVAEFIAALDSHLDRIERLNAQYGQIMLDLGWPPDSELPFAAVSEIVTIYESEGRERAREFVDNSLIAYYDSDSLWSIVGSWQENKWFHRRLPILREAITAHTNGLYFLSIPPILAQIEGVISDGYGHVGRLNGSRLADYCKRLLGNPRDLSLDSEIQDFYLNVVLDGFEHGTIPASELSRHAIMHGGDLSYGTEKNSLKCILLFNYLQARFRLVSVGNGACYHRMGCPVVRHRRDSRTLFDSKEEAERLGKVPCKKCRADSFYAA